ncbi:hypothetical protein HaLaN_24715, partial [Haematococcus lacustris]
MPPRAGGWTGTPTPASTSSALGRASSAPWSCAAGRTWRLCLPLARSTSRAISWSMTSCPRFCLPVPPVPCCLGMRLGQV